jgi:NADH:ubiquinone oxidoreductase subunit 6 (subunit J)
MLLAFENPIYSIFTLVLVFFAVSFLLMELNLFFLSLMILIVYLGALIVLFLFVVMMLNIKALELNRSINFFPSIFIGISSFFLLLINDNFQFFGNAGFTLHFFTFTLFNTWSALYFHFASFLNIGFLLYSFGFYILILVSLILLVAMLGAIVLTLNIFRNSNRQTSNDQILQFTKIELINFIK